MSVLEATELYRFFHIGDDEVVALRGVTIMLDAGEFAALRGPSGSGKSTLLACLSGIDEPDGGMVSVLGERMTRRPEPERARLRARHLGLLMQSGNLFEHLTVRANIRLQMQISGCDRPDEIDGLIGRLGLDGLADALPIHLSGGEAARAGLAAALAAKPAILLCDEPTAEVDAITEQRVIDCLIEICRGGTAVLIVTHSSALAERADRIIDFRDGDIVHG
ncbi:ABC transporter ATP-binding protein [Rhizobium leguminosarum]|uniref:ATP-binding cassette domain-containing protein n=1 Tax=Rhizobium leguminosarum TaxID=384 RepID=A0ABD7PKH0_RHILE|nr:ATP-binding cassette domain-containing protein [Rhizobium leguminosarum]TAV64728.1 ATP-binding cassette domain-containing protein [Rhizobium leguminosarum]TAV65186.1 ATP-binding cassette domain-containing protein [Rhizobium leguminosarum]TAW25175.1 ATP-binding cassette domain-containing protein [Rhizobium leguminosarum]TAW38946.1 ATP-binding cassette domain-containing protein [Rhizobium leguminosarum]TAY71752.1 ATP-binding cassette domain-containing protein [Rhizobium leguminosarum]